MSVWGSLHLTNKRLITARAEMEVALSDESRLFAAGCDHRFCCVELHQSIFLCALKTFSFNYKNFWFLKLWIGQGHVCLSWGTGETNRWKIEKGSVSQCTQFKTSNRQQGRMENEACVRRWNKSLRLALMSCFLPSLAVNTDFTSKTELVDVKVTY